MSLLATPRFAYLQHAFADRRKPLASRMSYALMALEDEALSAMCAAVNGVDGARVLAYIFDGAVVAPGAASPEHLLAAINDALIPHGVSAVAKPWPEL